MKIIYSPASADILLELVEVLYKWGYFSNESSAQTYVDELCDDIEKNLPIKLKKPVPVYFESKYGKGTYYAVFRTSKQTCWYVLFRMFEENGELIYQIRHITNNHVDAKYFNHPEIGN